MFNRFIFVPITWVVIVIARVLLQIIAHAIKITKTKS